MYSRSMEHYFLQCARSFALRKKAGRKQQQLQQYSTGAYYDTTAIVPLLVQKQRLSNTIITYTHYYYLGVR